MAQSSLPKVKPPKAIGKEEELELAEADKILKLADEQSQPRRLTRKTLALWLLTIAVGLLFLPLYTISATISDDIKAKQGELTASQKQLTTVPTLRQDIAKVVTPLAQTQGQVSQINTVYPTIVAPRPNWPDVMAAIGSYNSSQITPISLSRKDNLVTLTGRATNDSVAVSYARALEQSPLFTRVIVQSIQLVATPVVTPTVTRTVLPTLPATATRTQTPWPTSTQVPTAVPVPNTATPVPTATPPPTLTPTLYPTPSMTPDLRDQYEPDDNNPHTIMVSELQTHNFYPSGDVDKITFLAKMNRYYQVITSNLVLGVDTVLQMTLNGQQWTNDDYSTGSGNFASAVCFQAAQDGSAVGTITNKTQLYGGEKKYVITAIEIPNLNAANCPIATSRLSASSRSAGLLKSIALTELKEQPRPLLVSSTTVVFVIVVELKVPSP
jgi:hypothetical protein